jgi:predicted MFS family arabinose efflux permease
MSDSKQDAGGVPQEIETSADNGDSQNSPSTSPSDETEARELENEKTKTPSRWRRAYEVAFWVPPNCRWDPNKPPKFSMGLNILFAFAGAFTVATLYYNHPILNILAHDFGVPYDKVAQIPTLAQAGYAVGLFFLCPLGDLLKRRPFVLSLVLFTATMSIGLCLTPSLAVFSTIQFITGVTTVTPQLMLPLVGDLAPPNKRAAALSIVVSGFVVGILVARLLSGILTNYTSWRNVYWMSVGLQYAIFGSLWCFMPDYPATNKHLNYFKMLWSMFQMLGKHSVLVQACLISFFTSSTFTNFWTVLTFLLAGPPYHYNSVTIGLFALIGLGTMVVTPLYARLIIDRWVPWFSVILGLIWCMLGICVGAYTGTFTVAGPIIEAFFLDIGMQSAQIANRSTIYTIEPKGRNRINTCFMVFTFFGQLTGTSVGAHLFARGGWIGSQSFAVGCIGMALLLTFARGPWENGWVGWHGGLSIKKKNKTSADGKNEEPRNHLRRMSTNEPRPVGAKANSGDIDLEKNELGGAQTAVVGDLEKESRSGVDDGKELDVEKASAKSEEDGLTLVTKETT